MALTITTPAVWRSGLIYGVRGSGGYWLFSDVRSSADPTTPRKFFVFIPAAVQSPAPVVVWLHGGTTTQASALAAVSWQDKAEAEGFVYVAAQSEDIDPTNGVLDTYASGTPKTYWRGGHEGGQLGDGWDDLVDDVTFLAEVSEYVRATYDVSDQWYWSGHSAGWAMAMRVAAERPEHVTALAGTGQSRPNFGAVDTDPAKTWDLTPFRNPTTARPIMVICGDQELVGARPTLDDVANGYPGATSDQPWPEQLCQIWADLAGLNRRSLPFMLPDTDPADGVETWRVDWSSPTSALLISWCEMRGGGHHWPGDLVEQEEVDPGARTYDFDATDLCWEFFTTQALSQPIEAGCDLITAEIAGRVETTQANYAETAAIAESLVDVASADVGTATLADAEVPTLGELVNRIHNFSGGLSSWRYRVQTAGQTTISLPAATTYAGVRVWLNGVPITYPEWALISSNSALFFSAELNAGDQLLIRTYR